MINEKMMQIRKERKEKERTEFTECSMVHELFVYQNSKSKECSSIMCNL